MSIVTMLVILSQEYRKVVYLSTVTTPSFIGGQKARIYWDIIAWKWIFSHERLHWVHPRTRVQAPDDRDPMRLTLIHLWRKPICIIQYNYTPTWCWIIIPTLSCTTLWERELIAMNRGLTILTPTIINPIYWLSHCHMAWRERSSARCYCTKYEFGEQQGRSNPRGIRTLLAVVEEQRRSNPHEIWNLFAVGEYANWLAYTQFSGCIPLIWGEYFDVLIGTCDSTLILC